jgi:hypothetical protein
MIGIFQKHAQAMTEACTDWCEATVRVLYEGKRGRNRYKYTLKREIGGGSLYKKTYQYRTLYQKVKRVSLLYLQEETKALRKCEKRRTRKFLLTVIKDIFGDLRAHLSADGGGLRIKFDVCNNNIRRDSLYESVYKALKVPMEELYDVMRDLKQDDVFKKLNIRTCPYCNRHYTFTLKPVHKGDPNTSPEFDHFYPKSEYPTLAICFYNLVPSCHCCNHGKSTSQLNINPYFDEFKGVFYLCKAADDFTPLNQKEAKDIKTEQDVHIAYGGRREEIEDVERLGLDKLYGMHQDYVTEIVDKVNAYNSAVAQGLVDSFQGVYQNRGEIFEFVWGRHLELAELEDKPLSKFTRDLLTQMEVRKG